jgi:hypothetical protein
MIAVILLRIVVEVLGPFRIEQPVRHQSPNR